jgi:class 3 adenylate cyclase
VRRFLRFLYRRLGRRYPRVVTTVQFQLNYVVMTAGVALLALYQDVTFGQMAELVGLALVITTVYLVKDFRAVSCWLRPADVWLRGDHSEEATVAAWRAVVGLPRDWLSNSSPFQVVAGLIPWAAFAAWRLDLAWFNAVPLVAGGAVILLYSAAVRYFALELSLRPVLEDISQELPDNLDLGELGIPLRTKLLLALPAINIVTGVLVAGLSTDGTAHLSDLGLDVLVAVLVSLTTAAYVGVLLSRSIAIPIEDLRAATERLAQGDLQVRVPIISADEVGALAQSFNAAVAGLAEREQLHAALGSYVDPAIADRILAEGVELAGEEVEVSVLMLDVRGFTTYAEREGASATMASLRSLWDDVVPALGRHHGHANKFIGDGLLGVFGAPDHLPDHADRAVAAALEIARLTADRPDGLRVGIGVNSGPVVAGTIGGGGKLEFTVIGDAVNTAARVEAYTRITGDDVLITGETRSRLSDGGEGWVERGSVELRGKQQIVRLYAPPGSPAVAPMARGDEVVAAARVSSERPLET